MQPLAAVAGTLLPGLDAPPERRTAARNSRRARAWREQLERVAGHALEHASTAADRDAVDEAHRAAVAHGPDWARIRRGSDYARPVAVKDRNQLDRLLRWFARLERETYAADRAWARHERRNTRRTIPRTVRAILAALIALARKYATVHPSIERLANMGQMSRRTAVGCLDVLEELGLVVRHRRRRRERTELGLVREVQDCNAYVLAMPEGIDIEAKPRPPAAAIYQSAKVAQQSKIKVQSITEASIPAPPRPSTLPPMPPARPSAHATWRERARTALEQAQRGATCIPSTSTE